MANVSILISDNEDGVLLGLRGLENVEEEDLTRAEQLGKLVYAQMFEILQQIMGTDKPNMTIQ